MLLVGCLIPLLVIGRYNVMAADDYSSGKGLHRIWEQTGNVLEVWKGAFRSIIWAWHNWMGYFTGCFLGGLNPVIYSEKLACVTPILMLGMLLLATYLFVKTVIRKFYPAEKQDICFLWGVMAFLLLETLPSPVEALYWYGGAGLYTFLHYAMLLLFVFLIKSESLKRMPSKILAAAGIAIYAFVIGGCQYATVLQCLLWYIGYLFINRKKLSWQNILPFLSLLLGFGLSVTAPGNMIRRSNAYGNTAFSAIMKSLLMAPGYVRKWFSPLLIVCLLAALPVIWKIIKREKNITYQLPGLVSAGSFCLFAAAFTPSLYGVGNVAAGRIQNQMQSIFYIMIWINAFYWTGWIQRKMENRKKGFWKDCCAIKEILKKYLWTYRWLAFALVLLVFVGTSDKNTFSSMSALRSLVNGEARSYYEQAQERLALYQDDTISVVEVEPFTVRPKVLYFTDVVEEGNVNYWINENIADYYGKEKILLK